jgi:hypothetical protein
VKYNATLLKKVQCSLKISSAARSGREKLKEKLKPYLQTGEWSE